MDLHVHLNYAAESLGNAAAKAYKNASVVSKEMGVVVGIPKNLAAKYNLV